MMQDYIALEKLRYGDRLDISVNVRGDLSGKSIAPLLLLPFLENSFKHGASEQLEQAWMSLDLIVKDNSLKMKLINGVNEQAQPSDAAHDFHGIGLPNVRKRLALLYPGQHELKISRAGETFMVSLTVELDSAIQMEFAPAQPALSYGL
jgi:LytS/YehU family sensor histidine kinase